MNHDTAKMIVLQLYHDSRFFKGVLVSREAWTPSGFPEVKDEAEAKNLAILFRQLADAVEGKKEGDK